MNLKDVLAKINKAETLTDEEKAYLSKFDYDAELNAAAAAARRKAEGDRDALKTELDKLNAAAAEKAKADAEAKKASMTAAEKQAADFKALQAKVAQLEKDKAEEAKRAAALQREQDIVRLREKAGIQFAANIDPAITGSAFARAFDGLDDLTNEQEVASRIKRFKDANLGLIADNTGRGSGLGGSPAGDALAKNNPWAKETENITKQAEIELSNPSLAAELKAAAGYETA